MNYHFKNKAQPTVGELLSPQKQSQKLKQLKDFQSAKSKQRKKLQAQFYQDDNIHLQLADKVMDQIISQSSKKKQRDIIQQKIREKQIFKKKFNQNLIQSEVYVDIRQQQKQKLQKFKQDFFPFQNKSFKQKEKLINIPVSDRSPQPNKIYKNNYINKIQFDSKNGRSQTKQQKMESPFGKQSLFLQQKRLQMEKNYLTALKRQIKQKQIAKNKQKMQQKQKRFNQIKILQLNNANDDDEKVINKLASPRSPRGRGAFDPNSKPPVFSHYIGDTDILYIKSKAEQLKSKCKKGRIDENEYQNQLKKIQNFYGKPLKQLIPDFDQNKSKIYKNKAENNSQTNKDKIIEKDSKVQKIQQNQQGKNKSLTPQISQSQNKNNNAYRNDKYFYDQKTKQKKKSKPLQYEQQKEQLIYKNANIKEKAEQEFKLVQKFGAMQLQMMNRMLKQMRQLYRSNIQNQQKFMQDTLMRYSMKQFPKGYQHNQQNIKQFIKKSSIQIPQNQRYYNSNLEASQKYRNINLSDDYFQNQSSGLSLKQIQQFYNKPYKIKPLKNFQYIQQGNKQIPYQQYIQTHGKKILKRIFQMDLEKYKRVQLQEQGKKLLQMRKKKIYQIPQQSQQSQSKVSPRSPKNANFIKNQIQQSDFSKKKSSKINDVLPTFNNFQDFNNHTKNNSLKVKEDSYNVDISQAKEIRKLKTKSHRKLIKQSEYIMQKIKKNNDQFFDNYQTKNIYQNKEQLDFGDDLSPVQEKNQITQTPQRRQSEIKDSRIDSLKNSSRNSSSKSKGKNKKQGQIRMKFPLNKKYDNKTENENNNKKQNEQQISEIKNIQNNDYKQEYYHEKRLQFNKPLIISPKMVNSKSNNKSSKRSSSIHQGSAIKSFQQARQVIYKNHLQDNYGLFNNGYGYKSNLLRDKLMKVQQQFNLSSSQRKYMEENLNDSNNKFSFKPIKQSYEQSHKNIMKILNDLDSEDKRQQRIYI